MARFKLTPDKPRPLSRCGATVAPGQDARWRGFGLAGSKVTKGTWGKHGGYINTVQRLEIQRKQRDSK